MAFQNCFCPEILEDFVGETVNILLAGAAPLQNHVLLAVNPNYLLTRAPGPPGDTPTHVVLCCNIAAVEVD